MPRRTSMFLLLFLPLLCAAADRPVPPAPPGARAGTELVADGAWCWFADPRAVRVKGERDRTYIGWVTSKGDIRIGAYDHASGAFETATLHPKLNADDHANPGLLVLPDKRLMVFYSGHSRRPMYDRTSGKPEDITAWGDERRVTADISGGNGYTYANPVLLAEEKNRIYLFWRGGNWQPAFAWSDDLGTTWSKAHHIIQAPKRTPPYVKVATDGKARIHLAYTDGHPRHMATNNIYYACYHDGAFHKADGSKIKAVADLPFRTGEGDLVYHAKAVVGGRGWIWDIALDGAGRPVIVFAAMPAYKDHRYRYAVWDGEAWHHHEICSAGGYIDGSREMHYSGGIILDHRDPRTVYLSRQVKGVHELDRWVTPDGGKTWTTTPITSGSAKKNVRPVVPRGPREGGLGVIWMHGDYHYWTRYGTSLRTWPPLKEKPRE